MLFGILPKDLDFEIGSIPTNQKKVMRTLPQFEPLLSDAEAGELLGLHPKTVQRMARRGAIPAIRIGRYWRFRASELDSWVDVHSTCQPACVGKGEE